jgi:hypothetical protein
MLSPKQKLRGWQELLLQHSATHTGSGPCRRFYPPAHKKTQRFRRGKPSGVCQVARRTTALPAIQKNRHFPLEKIFEKMARFFAQTAM